MIQMTGASNSWICPNSPELDVVIVRCTDGTVQHRVHATADLLAQHHAFIALDTVVVTATDRRMLVGAASTPYVAKRIEFTKRKGKMHVRGKTAYGMHDQASMLKALAAKGVGGVCRVQIMGEYEQAYTDVAELIRTDQIFATAYRVWSRVAVPATDPRITTALRAQLAALDDG
jgi:hypothetical protein